MIEECWSDWHSHDGKRIPVPHGTLCQVETKDGELITDTSIDFIAPGHCSLWIWATLPEGIEFMGIVRYRFRRLKALEDLRALVENPYEAPAIPVAVPA